MFEITSATAEAFHAYLASEPKGGGEWLEHWALHDLLDEADVLAMPLCPPCCYHPGLPATRWDVIPEALAIYRHLSRSA